jgi:ATP-binding cassette subfamily A (ABC1) protein 3
MITLYIYVFRMLICFLISSFIDGSGKSTTLGVLTGDITPTSGSAYVAGNDVTGLTPGGVASARQHIGFCPQMDPLLDLMTGRETLTMFGRLRGLPREVLVRAIPCDIIISVYTLPY